MIARRLVASLMLAALWLVAAQAQARPQLSTITLTHRPASELVPVLQPLLGQHEMVTGDAFTLILNVEPARLESLRATVEQLDRAPRRLRITVRQELAAEERMRGAGVSGSIGNDQARVIVSPPDAGHGAQARYRGIGVYGTDPGGRQREANEQTVVTLEGRPAQIAIGLVAPFASLCEDQFGARRECTQYREVSTGFEVLARLSGQGVTLDVAPRAEQLSEPGMVSFQVAQTQLHGALGEWLEVAGETSAGGGLERNVIASTARSSRSERRIAIKVELE